jgi:integrase
VIELVERVHERAPVGANRLLGSLQRFFKWAAARDLVEASPAAAVEKPGRETTRGRVLTDAELLEIWRAAERMGGPYGTGIRLLILTAARRGEIFRARRDELDGAAGRLLVPAERSKNGEPRSVWLSPLALDLVGGLPEFAASPWLLTTDGRSPFTNYGYNRRRLDTLILEARREKAVDRGQDPERVDPMPEWWVHDLRRTAATGMQRLGVRLEAVEAALGHVSGSRSGVVGVYQRHRFEEEARAALTAWGEHVRALVSAKEGGGQVASSRGADHAERLGQCRRPDQHGVRRQAESERLAAREQRPVGGGQRIPQLGQGRSWLARGGRGNSPEAIRPELSPGQDRAALLRSALEMAA